MGELGSGVRGGQGQGVRQYTLRLYRIGVGGLRLGAGSEQWAVIRRHTRRCTDLLTDINSFDCKLHSPLLLYSDP